jgi:hypothetical protein
MYGIIHILFHVEILDLSASLNLGYTGQTECRQPGHPPRALLLRLGLAAVAVTPASEGGLGGLAVDGGGCVGTFIVLGGLPHRGTPGGGPGLW